MKIVQLIVFGAVVIFALFILKWLLTVPVIEAPEVRIRELKEVPLIKTQDYCEANPEWCAKG